MLAAAIIPLFICVGVQVTAFIEYIFNIYNKLSMDQGHGRLTALYLWSDNCSAQFKCRFVIFNLPHSHTPLFFSDTPCIALVILFRYYYGWGSQFLQKFGLKWLSYNYFAASHGKGVCDSEGGHVKNKLSKAMLAGVNLRSCKELYKYLLANCLDVAHRTFGEFDRHLRTH